MDARDDVARADTGSGSVAGVSPENQAEVFDSIITSVQAGVVACDPQARIMWVNPLAAAMFGRAPAELIGRPVTVLMSSATRQDIRTRWPAILAGEQTSPILVHGPRRDGQACHISITPSVRRDRKGQPIGATLTLRDVTAELHTERQRSEALARSRARFDQSTKPQALLDIDGRIVDVNDAGCRLFGPSVAELVGRELLEVIRPRDVGLVRDQLSRMRDGELGAADYETTITREDGSRVALQVEITVVRDADGRACEFAAYARDLTELRAAQDRLVGQQALFGAIAESVQEGILAVARSGTILFANERLTEILAMSLDEVQALAGKVAPGEAGPGRLAGLLFGGAAGPAPERFDVTHDLTDGRTRVLSVSTRPLRAEDGTLVGNLALVSDITEQRSAETSLRHQALHDPLTDLPNRLLFMDRLSTAKARFERSRTRGLAVLFLDLDDFKEVNDTCGHVVGDEVLVEVASRLADAVRSTDTVARIGGDEFAVICEDADTTVATEVAWRIQATLQSPVEVEGHSFGVGASVGVALAPPYDVADLLRLADRAMYRAKGSDQRPLWVYDGSAES